MKKNPKENCTRIANVFSEKYGRKIGRMTVSRLKENMEQVEVADVNNGIRNMKYITAALCFFEADFYAALNKKLEKTNLVFETCKIIAMRVQASEKYKEVPEIQRLKFSKTWWQNFKKRSQIPSKEMTNQS